MSWDIALMRTADDVQSLNDLKSDFYPPSFGKRTDVITRLQIILPGLDFSNEWGVYKGENYSITLHLAALDDPDEVNTMAANIRGEGDALVALRLIWTGLSCSAFDYGTGKRIDNIDDPEKGFRDWKGFRDHALNSSESDLVNE